LATSLNNHLGERELEKLELQAVLSSKQFARSHGLIQFLSYVCEHYFDGTADQVKEYNIAVEAFGRPASFQQRVDPIVRVEANRLRKRLKDYYDTDGKEHSVQITIPPGQYLPVFVHLNNSDTRPEVDAQPSPQNGLKPELPCKMVLPRKWIWIVSGFVLLIVLIWIGKTALSRFNATPTGTSLPASQPNNPSSNAGSNLQPLSPMSEVRILAGSNLATYVDFIGEVWSGDRYFRGGTAAAYPHASMDQTRDPVIFQSARIGTFYYDIPLKPGLYELHLFFSENVFGPHIESGGGEGSRKMNIMANGKALLSNFDIYSDVGGAHKADVKIFTDITPEDGFLHLLFFGSPGAQATLNGIQILPGEKGKMLPLRMTTRDTPYRTSDKRIWIPDIHFQGGLLANPSPLSVVGTTDSELYQQHRYGHFTYQIPVVPGSYTLKLKFVESFFGTPGQVSDGQGARLFDVFCNGQVLLRNFDIFKEAGGQNRALDKTFSHIRPNAQDKIVLSLVPVRDYACLSAIELIPE
jgi:hypothetical protein